MAKSGAKNPTKNPRKHRRIVSEKISNEAAVIVPKNAAPKDPYTQGSLLPYLLDTTPDSNDPKNIETKIADAFIIFFLF